MTEPHYSRRLFRGGRQHHELGTRALERVAVAFVDEELRFVAQQSLGADDASDFLDESGRQHCSVAES
ncbi:hypothetical protein D3C83_249970 [compost metagenome]